MFSHLFLSFASPAVVHLSVLTFKREKSFCLTWCSWCTLTIFHVKIEIPLQCLYVCLIFKYFFCMYSINVYLNKIRHISIFLYVYIYTKIAINIKCEYNFVNILYVASLIFVCRGNENRQKITFLFYLQINVCFECTKWCRQFSFFFTDPFNLFLSNFVTEVSLRHSVDWAEVSLLSSSAFFDIWEPNPQLVITLFSYSYLFEIS